MPANEVGAAPAKARPWTGIGEVGQREEAWRLAMGEQPRAGTGIGEVGKWEQRRRLAKREQPQRGKDCGQEWAISGRGKRDAGWRRGSSTSGCATADRRWPRGAAGRRMPACGVGAAPARERNCPSQRRGRAMLAGEEGTAQRGQDHGQELSISRSAKRWQLAKRGQPQRVRDRMQQVATLGSGKRDGGWRRRNAPASAWLRAGGSRLWERQEEQGRRRASREQLQRVRDRMQQVATLGSGKRDGGLRRGSSPRECTTVGRNGPRSAEGRGMPAGEGGVAYR